MNIKIISVLVIIFTIILAGCSTGNASFGQYDSLAQCLTEKGVKMFGTEWCSHCKNQKALFGKSFQYVNYIDCDQNKQVCDNAGVSGYPTWQINGQKYPGEQSLSKLASLSGCEVN